MRKFVAVVRHEYTKLVFKWSFLIGTLLFPLLASMFAIVPAIIFSLRGEPTRIVVIDQSGKVAPRVKENLSAEKLMQKAEQAMKESFTDLGAGQDEEMKRNAEMFAGGFAFVDYDLRDRTLDEARADLNARIVADEIDAYLIVPENFAAPGAVFEFRSRKAGDFITNETLKDALNVAVRSQRLADANISEERLDELNKKINFDEKGIGETGEEKDATGTLIASFAIGLMIYITLTIYGQAIMAAVVEEKETRIAEILFSSASPFELMMGKLVGVGLGGLTQLVIWTISAAVLIAVVSIQMAGSEIVGAIPAITPLMIVYFMIFFLLGYFIYASIFALIGSMVTTVQEGSQFAFPPIMLMLVGFYFCFAVVRDPGSTLSFWVSIAPFFAPLTMPIRIMAETPPFWQIALSIIVNSIAIAGLVWLTARVYRIGMLMYGKRATIPEVMKWIRQA